MESKPFWQSSVLVSTAIQVIGFIFILAPKVKTAFDAAGMSPEVLVTGVVGSIGFVASIIAAIKRLKNVPSLPITGTPAAK